MLYLTALSLLASVAFAAPAPAPAPEAATEGNVPGRWVGHCFGTPLDHGDTDRSHDALFGWARNGPIINTAEHNEYVPFYSGNVFAYACTDDHYGSNFFDDNDVNAAYYTMDQACPRYTASWAIYQELVDGLFYRNTGKIIGKDVVGHPVCQGSNGA